jgi:hypothetical protein
MPYNERFDEGYAKNWGIAVISSKNGWVYEKVCLDELSNYR